MFSAPLLDGLHFYLLSRHINKMDQLED